MINCILLKLGDECHNKSYSHLWPYLSDRNRSRISRYVFSIDANRSLMAEMLIKKILSERYCITKTKINHTEYGQPFLKEFPNIKISISHSGRWVGIIIADNGLSVGLDVQKISCVTEKTIAAMHIENEKNREKHDSNIMNQELISYWCFKEAYAKYTGKGLSEMNTILKLNNENIDIEKGVSFYGADIDEDHKLGIALTYKNSVNSVNINKMQWHFFSRWLRSLE